MLTNGSKYYTIDFENLSEENVRDNSNYLIKTNFWYDDILDNNLLNMGVCFETEEEAIEKAKQVYYRFKWDKLTKSCNVNGQFSAYYDKETNRVIPCQSKTIGERCTDTEEEMLHAIEEIGPVNYVKYILGLRVVTVYVPVSV